jgi:hypothetical protein
MPLKKKQRPRRGKDNLSYKRNRLKRVWSKLVDLEGESADNLEMLKDFLNDLVGGYADAGTFPVGKDPRQNGKQSPLEIF